MLYFLFDHCKIGTSIEQFVFLPDRISEGGDEERGMGGHGGFPLYCFSNIDYGVIYLFRYIMPYMVPYLQTYFLFTSSRMSLGQPLY